MQLNQITLIGRLTRDPEESFTPDGMELSKFALAVNRTGKPAREGDPTADFFNVVCFRQTAKFVNQYLRRGNLVAVAGRLRIDEYTSRDGERRTWVEVAATEVQNLTPRGDAAEGEPRGRRGGADRDFADDGQPAPREGRRSSNDRSRGPATRPPADDPYTRDEDDPFADE